MNDKYTNSDIRLQGPFFEKLDNFWYHYKWHTIAALFVTFVLVVCTVQACSRTKYDVNVLYAGSFLYEGRDKAMAVEELNQIMPRDFNGNGQKDASFVTYTVLSKEQIQNLEGSDKAIVDFTAESRLYYSAIHTGEYAVLLIDEHLFRELEKDEGRLRKLSDVFVTVPESAMSEYGIRFSKTALYQKSEQLGKLPESTVLCLLSPYVIGATSNKTAYAQMTEMFVAMAADES